MKVEDVGVWTQRVRGLFKSKSKKTKVLGWGLVALAVLTVYYLIFSVSYLNKVFPGVKIGSENFAGLTETQVKEKLTSLAATQSTQTIDIIIDETSFSITPSDIDYLVNTDKTAAAVYNYGRDPHQKLLSVWNQFQSPFHAHRLQSQVNYDPQLLSAKVEEFADQVDQPAIDAKGEIISNQVVLTKESDGLVVDREKILKEISKHLAEFASSTLQFSRQVDKPSIVLGDEGIIKAEVDRLADRQLTVKWPNGSKELSTKDIKKLIGFVGTNEIQPAILIARFTTEQIQNYLTSIADLTDSPAVDPLLIIKDGVLVISKKSQDGTVVDLATSAETLLKNLQTVDASPVVELTMKPQSPVISEKNLDTLGIKERIGYGETSFTGSPANRKHNIGNGVSLMQSALIKPGDEFSTVAALGAVDNTTGFLPELVIKENRTTPEYGGGLCQVSTTLFRSVLNAGLKVTERQNHSYRVSYYEPPVGLDATIYLPKPDFKFLNDTNAHILVQGRVVGSKVIFELWGTNDGRVPSVSTPQILSTTPSGEPIYADTDTLPKGEQKQIEKAHDGAVAIAYYTVTRNGDVINKQTFKSIYKPWPARFLVGTNESLPPTSP